MSNLSSNQFFTTSEWNPFAALATKVTELSKYNPRYNQAMTQNTAHNTMINKPLPAAEKTEKMENKMTDYQINDKAKRRSLIESNTSNIKIGPKQKTKLTPPGTKPKRK